jgi:hypothetical protein
VDQQHPLFPVYSHFLMSCADVNLVHVHLYVLVLA